MNYIFCCFFFCLFVIFFSDKIINFGPLPTGAEKTKLLTLKNTGKVPMVFRIEPPSECVEVSPLLGRVDVNDQTTISVSFLSFEELEYGS